MDKPSTKDKDLGKKQEAKGAKTESVSSEPESSMKDERKHWRKCVCMCVCIGWGFLVTPTSYGLEAIPQVNVHMSSCLSRTQEPRQDGNDKFQKRRSQLFQTKTVQEGTLF